MFTIIRVPEGEKKKGAESLFREIMAENIPNWERDRTIQVYKEILVSKFIISH